MSKRWFWEQLGRRQQRAAVAIKRPRSVARIAIDVCIGKRGAARLRDAGHLIVAVAEHGESDESWFARALDAAADVVVSTDRDLAVLCYEHRLTFIRAHPHHSGTVTALRVIHKLAAWAARGAQLPSQETAT